MALCYGWRRGNAFARPHLEPRPTDDCGVVKKSLHSGTKTWDKTLLAPCDRCQATIVGELIAEHSVDAELLAQVEAEWPTAREICPELRTRIGAYLSDLDAGNDEAGAAARRRCGRARPRLPQRASVHEGSATREYSPARVTDRQSERH